MSSTTLQQRRPHSHTNIMNQAPTSSTDRQASTPAFSSAIEPTLTSSTLLKSNPIHHSKIYKLKVPFVYTILPTPLLNITQILFYPLIKLCNIQTKPFWVERYFILIGNYLYKFQPNSKGSMGRNNMKMKGSPIDLKLMNVTPCHLSNNGTTVICSGSNNSNNNNSEIDIPRNHNCHGYFTITTKGSKTTLYATQTQIDAHTWTNTLHQARQECITASMGHSKLPVSRQIEYVNMMGKRIVDRKERVANMIKKRELDEVEMMCLNAGGGTVGGGGLPRGYFG